MFVAVIILLLAVSVQAQPQPADFVQHEKELAVKLALVVSEKSYTARNLLNDEFHNDFERVLGMEGSFGYAFDSLKNVGKLVSDDGAVRIFTWNVPQVDGTQRYFGFLQHIGTDGKPALFRLNDQRKPAGEVVCNQYDVNEWQGALYYQIVTINAGQQKYYVIMGYDYNNLFTSKKLIEVLSFNSMGQPVFGLPIFAFEKKPPLMRVVFEFSARAAMSLRYEAKFKTIVFDHLSPSSPQYAGNYQFYGPDFSYDGFKLDGGQWRYVSDLDMRNNARPKNTPAKAVRIEAPAYIYKPNYKTKAK